MGETSYGGIRAGGGGRFGATVALQLPTSSGSGDRQAGSPYSDPAPSAFTSSAPPTANVLVMLVLLEVLVLVALRHGFRLHHGG